MPLYQLYDIIIIMKTIYDILEVNKVLSQLSDFADSDGGKSLCLNLKIISDKESLTKALNETDGALSYLKSSALPSFLKLYDVNESLLRLSKEASLNTSELLNISNCLDLAQKLIAYRDSKEYNTCLDVYFNALDALKDENNEIKRVVISEYEISDNASSILQMLRRKKQLLKEKIRTTANRLLNTYSQYLQEPVLANKDGAICLPVKSEFKNRVDGTIHSISGSQFTIFIEPKEIIGLNNEVAENESLEQIEIAKILYELSRKLSPYIDTIRNNYKNLTMLDFIFAKAKYAKDINATLPILNSDGKIDLKGARHPLLQKANAVPLNINLGINFTSLIITGPNTGGKTVSLKTVGLIEIMGLSGLFIPCEENSHISLFDNIFADIGDEQSIEQSLSTFSSHMNNIVSILNHVTSKSLVLLDEICTGTDPIEGANLAIAILDEFLSKKIRVIATTHYPELKKYALSRNGVENGAFEFNVDTLKPTYKLLIGIPGKSNAFAISEKLGLNKNIINKAKNMLNTNDVRFEDIVASLEESKITIDREKNEVAKYKNEIEELKNKVKRQEKGLNDRADSIIRQAKEKAHDILFDAKQLADETIKNIKNSGGDLNVSINERTKLNKGLSESLESLVEKVKGPSQPLSAKKIKIGATVKVLSLNAEGIVESLPDKSYNLFVRVGILRTQVNLRDLELVDSYNVKIDGTKIKKTINKDGSSKIKLEKSYNVNSEINLIGKTTDEAILELDKYIDDAYIAHIPFIRVIHGRGTGALKKAVNEFCRKSKIIKNYRPGDFTEGGDGVTVISFE
ncbi:MAG: endonuclease MutS2 [Lachnospiraceae bacterium]|nr:endonuclease MutS2 [Lachnospiraceae bacterium]